MSTMLAVLGIWRYYPHRSITCWAVFGWQWCMKIQGGRKVNQLGPIICNGICNTFWCCPLSTAERFNICIDVTQPKKKVEREVY